MPHMQTRALDAKKSEKKKMEKFERTNEYPLMRGKVEDNNDPLGIGRIKVRVHSVHGGSKTGTKTKDLPWAMPCLPGTSYDSGPVIIPEVNTTVWCLFEDGDENKIVYIGGMYGKGVTKGNAVGNTNGERRNQRLGRNEKPTEGATLDKKVLYKSPKRAYIMMDDTKGKEELVIHDHLGQVIRMKSPFKPGVSIANLESMTKEVLLNKKSTFEVELINESKVTVETYIEEEKSTIEGELKGEKPIKMNLDTKEGKSEFEWEGDKPLKLTIDVKEGKVKVSLDETEIEMTDKEVKVKAKKGVDVVSDDKVTAVVGASSFEATKTSATVSSQVVDVNAQTINLNAPVINLGD